MTSLLIISLFWFISEIHGTYLQVTVQQKLEKYFLNFGLQLLRYVLELNSFSSSPFNSLFFECDKTAALGKWMGGFSWCSGTFLDFQLLSTLPTFLTLYNALNFLLKIKIFFEWYIFLHTSLSHTTHTLITYERKATTFVLKNRKHEKEF